MNMKSSPLPFALAFLLATGCSKAPEAADGAQDSAAEMKMSADEHAKMAGAKPPAAAPAKTGAATGTVESVDEAGGKITLAHGPVEALGWPAMTMAFRATPEQIASVKAGQKVRFEFTSEGMDATITTISPE